MRFVPFAAALAFAVALATAPAAAAPPAPLKLLFLGDDGHHQPAARFRQLAPVMKARNIDLVYTNDANNLDPQTLRGFNGIVLYANIDNIADDQADALLDFVAGGKGFVPLHCASYCFRNNDQVVALIGGQFLRHGTGTFRTSITRADHPVMKGFQGFESWDETYVHTMHNERDRTVLETRMEGDGEEPWTWVRTHGKGRVFYTAWGHDERTWENPGFQNLVERGIRWACGQDPAVAGPFRDRPEMTTLAADLKPFDYIETDGIPFYPPNNNPGATDHAPRTMQLPVSPEESQKHFVTPAGFEVKLFASEENFQGKPIAMNWDDRGRLWMCETTDYPNELQPIGQGRDRIRICEDTDGDWVADKFTVFADRLSIPTAIAFYGGGAIVQDGTETVYLKDTDGDDRADLRKVLVAGWALGDTHGGVSNFQYGLDNWYYAMQGYNDSRPVLTDGRAGPRFRMGFFRFQVTGDGEQTAVSEIEFLRSTNNNTWGLGLSEEGLVFGSTANGNPSEFMPIPNRYYEAVRGWSSSVLEGIADSNRFQPLDEQQVRQVDHHGGFTAAAGHALYTARNYPREYWNRAAFVTEATGHLIATFLLRADGAGFRSRNAWNLLASNDEWSAPIMAEVGPDGNVWLIDWYNFIVQHNPTPAGFQTGRGNAYESELRDKTHGRIYRLVYVGEDGESRDQPHPPVVNLSQATDKELIAALAHDNFLWRRQAQRRIVEADRFDKVQPLIDLVGDTSVDELGLNAPATHALWALHGRGVLDGTNRDAKSRDALRAAVAALRHPAAGVRRNAVQVLPASAASATAIVDSGVLLDPNPQVQLAALLALADMSPAESAARALVEVLAASGLEDRWLKDASISAAARHDRFFLTEALRTRTKLPPATADVLSIVAEHFARGGPTDAVRPVLLSLNGADNDLASAVTAGLARGWPRDKPATLDESTEDALVALLKQLPPAARGALANLSARLGSRKLESFTAQIAADFLTQATDDSQSEADRLEAARQLVEFRRLDPQAASDLLQLISPRTPPSLGIGLIEAIGRSEAPDAGETLVEGIGSLTPAVRPTAIRVLLSRADWSGSLLDALDDGTVQLSELSLDQKQSLAAHPNRALAERAKQLLSRGGGLPNPDRQKVLEELLPLTERTADAVAGKEVFKKQCAKCHTHSGEGTKIGPDLTGMAVHPKKELLTQIIDPSRSVEGNFRAYGVILSDGRVMNGLLASESQTAIEIFDTEGKKHAIQRDDIDELVASPKSIMPEGFEKQVKPEEIANLLEFLTQRGKFLPLPLAKAATVVTTIPMFHDGEHDEQKLIFPDWSPKVFEGVPFVLIDPQDDRIANAIMLHGTNGDKPPRMPKSVSLPCNAPARLIHFLGGVSGWGFPAAPAGTPSMTVRLKYADGQTEDHVTRNGEVWADYITKVDVPGSKFAYRLRGQQLRYFSIAPARPDTIESIELLKGNDPTSPVVMAITVESPMAKQAN